MRNIVRNILLNLLHKLGMRVSIYIQSKGEWKFFVERDLKILPRKDDIIFITYNDNKEDYKVVEVVIQNGSRNPTVKVECKSNYAPVIIDTSVDYKKVSFFTRLFKKNK